MKLPAPYYSQWLDVADPYWMPRACAIACMKMIFDYYKKEAPDILTMAREGEEQGGYGPSGWRHDYQVNLFKNHGLSAHREEKIEFEGGVTRLKNHLEGGDLAIISVVDFLLEQTRFHQVLLVGYEEGVISGTVKGFYYHDPANTDRSAGAYRYVSIEKFKEGWRRMAIFTSPLTD